MKRVLIRVVESAWLVIAIPLYVGIRIYQSTDFGHPPRERSISLAS